MEQSIRSPWHSVVGRNDDAECVGSRSGVLPRTVPSIQSRVGSREEATAQTGRVRLWAPDSDQIQGLLSESIATSLAAAFSSRTWTRTPMPIGDESDAHSARGIIATLGGRFQVLLASAMEPGVAPGAQQVVGCVLGGVLDEKLIDAYGLGAHGARKGDGLLAYIGVVPSAQGARLSALDGGLFELTNSRPLPVTKNASTSLASLLFSRWLALPAISSCPAVFVRTRQVIKPILHLAAKNGFDYCGSFSLDFHGEKQDRMVFRRVNQ